MTEEKTGHVPGACAAKILAPGTKVPIVASGGYVPSVEDRLRAEIERLRQLKDCRLCANYTTQSGGCVSLLLCVGGDRFKATTPRRYWEERPIHPVPF